MYVLKVGLTSEGCKIKAHQGAIDFDEGHPFFAALELDLFGKRSSYQTIGTCKTKLKSLKQFVMQLQ